MVLTLVHCSHDRIIWIIFNFPYLYIRMRKDWHNHKQSVLSKSDKSFKQSIDRPVVSVVEVINSSDKFLTTSSCSGRIMLIREAVPDKRKNGAEFIFVSHELVQLDSSGTILSQCGGLEGNVFLKLEPLIIHVECESLELAVRLMHAGKEMPHLKHSCIVSAANNKYIVALKGMVKMEIPIVYGGDMLVDSTTFRRYLDIANKRMQENFDAIRFLETRLLNGLLRDLVFSPSITTESLQDRKPVLAKGEVEVGTLVKLSENDFKRALSAQLGTERISVHSSLRFAYMPDGTRIGIIPDNGEWPDLNVDTSLVFQSNGMWSIVTFGSDAWILLRTIKPNGKIELNWKHLAKCVVIREVFRGDKDDVYVIDSNQSVLAVDWTRDSRERRIVSVKSFKKFGDAIQINDESLSVNDARVYADNMKANLIVTSDGSVLYCRNGSTKSVLKENGVSFVIDFGVDSFGSSLVASRSRLSQTLRGGTLVEIASSVDCVSVAMAAKGLLDRVIVVVAKEDIGGLISESFHTNNSDNCQVFKSIDDLGSLPMADRLVVTDGTLVLSEDLITRIVKPNGSIYLRPDRLKDFKPIEGVQVVSL